MFWTIFKNHSFDWLCFVDNVNFLKDSTYKLSSLFYLHSTVTISLCNWCHNKCKFGSNFLMTFELFDEKNQLFFEDISMVWYKCVYTIDHCVYLSMVEMILNCNCHRGCDRSLDIAEKYCWQMQFRTMIEISYFIII